MPLLLQSMFPDSEIAKNFSCSESKARYIATFGLAPYSWKRLKMTVLFYFLMNLCKKAVKYLPAILEWE